MWDPTEPKPWEEEPEGRTIDEVRVLVRRQKELLSAVATGVSIASKAEEYSFRYYRLRRAYRRMGIENPFPWSDLFSFWGHISDWSTYAERRTEITRLMDEALDELDAEEDRAQAADDVPAWDLPAVDRWKGLAERSLDLKTEYETAGTLDDYQDVGRRARQLITEAVKLAWEDSMIPSGKARPKGDDAKAKLDQILAVRLPGPSNGRIRTFIRAALGLGHETTHSEDQEGLEALASAMGAVMAIRLLQELDPAE